MDYTMNSDEKVQAALHEERIKNLSADVTLILTNHIPHLQQDIKDLSEKTDLRFNSIEKKLAYWAGAIAVIVVVAQFVVPKILPL